MADPDTAKATADAVMEQLHTASFTVQFLVFEHLFSELSNGMDKYDRLDEIENDEDENDKEFECPHCFKQFAVPALQMTEIDRRVLDPYDHSNSERTIEYSGDDAGNQYEDFAFKCPFCALPVNLPKDWEHDWV